MSAIRKLRPPKSMVDKVRAESLKRMMSLVDARDEKHFDIIRSRGNSEAIRLLRKGADNWDAEELARAATLEAIDLQIENIRDASNSLETLSETTGVPADYFSDTHWPS